MLLQTALGPRASDSDWSTTIQSVRQQASSAHLSPGLGTEPLRVGGTGDVRKFLEATALEDLNVRARLTGHLLSEGRLQGATVSLGEALAVDVFWSLAGRRLQLVQVVCVAGGGLHVGASLVVRVVAVHRSPIDSTDGRLTAHRANGHR